MNDEPMNVSIEQSKLLGNALRVKIISVLQEEPKTAKQVADILGESGGNVHYHIKKLFDGGLLELVEEKQFGGVIEKYYQAKSKWFNYSGDETIDPALRDDFQSAKSTALSIRMNMTKQQEEQITKEFRAFLEKWVKNTNKPTDEETQEFSIGVKIVSTKQKNDKDKDVEG